MRLDITLDIGESVQNPRAKPDVWASDSCRTLAVKGPYAASAQPRKFGGGD
jgi:hypothetical protein